MYSEDCSTVRAAAPRHSWTGEWAWSPMQGAALAQVKACSDHVQLPAVEAHQAHELLQVLLHAQQALWLSESTCTYKTHTHKPWTAGKQIMNTAARLGCQAGTG